MSNDSRMGRRIRLSALTKAIGSSHSRSLSHQVEAAAGGGVRYLSDKIRAEENCEFVTRVNCWKGDQMNGKRKA